MKDAHGEWNPSATKKQKKRRRSEARSSTTAGRDISAAQPMAISAKLNGEAEHLATTHDATPTNSVIADVRAEEPGSSAGIMGVHRQRQHTHDDPQVTTLIGTGVSNDSQSKDRSSGVKVDSDGGGAIDEGVLVQRESPLSTAPMPGARNISEEMKGKKSSVTARETREAASETTERASSNLCTTRTKRGAKEFNKLGDEEQVAHDASGADGSSLPIPYALPQEGVQHFHALKANGRSRTSSIESAREFFDSTTVSCVGQTDGKGVPDAKPESKEHIGSGLGSEVSARRKRQRDEGVNGLALSTAERATRLPGRHLEQRRGLPIFAHRKEVIHAVKNHQTLVIVGETGSGKSTQIPQFLYEAGICGRGLGDASDGNLSKGNTMGSGSGSSSKRGRGTATDVVGNDHGWKNGGFKGGTIACTQPRRVAAITVAKRVAAEAGSELGDVVGYSVRFDDRTTKSTRIKYVTDGVLLREAMSDPFLSAYSAIVLDEAHERSLDTDILFGLIRRLQPKRPGLKVVVMSATLDVDLFRRFFRDSASLHVPGRTHPVDVMYATEDQEDYLEACLVTCLQIHEETEGDGDVLVFLPGQDAIEGLSQLLRENLTLLRAEKSRELAAATADANAAVGNEDFHLEPIGLKGQGRGLLRDTLVCPVFAALPQEQQLEAFEPAPKGTRKFVLATNIAETSITINGIRFVVDCGKVKVRSFQPSTGMEFLRERDVSKAQATQRAGRAGREAPGVCYRLYREDSYLELGDTPTPEILRVNLAQVVLQLKVMGIHDPSTFDYVTAPSRAALLKALKTLVMLGAVDKDAKVTSNGKKMAALPLDPLFAHLLVRSTESQFACAKEVLTTVACLSAENLFFFPPKEEARRAAEESHRAFVAYEGDLPTLLCVYESFLKERKDPNWCRRNFVNGRSVARAKDVRDQLAKILQERLKADPEASCGAEMSQYLRCLVAGLFMNVAMNQPAAASGGGRSCYRTALGSREVHVHPSSSLHRRNPRAKCVVFTELLSTNRDYIKTVTAVDASWLRELVPQFFKQAGA